MLPVLVWVLPKNRIDRELYTYEIYYKELGHVISWEVPQSAV